MSTLEKAIILLREMPEQSVEIVYRFMQSIKTTQNDIKQSNALIENNTTKNIEGLRILQSFAGILPDNFDYKAELEEARAERYERFN